MLRSAAEEAEPEPGEAGVFWKAGVHYRRSRLKDEAEEAWVDQIVLPRDCRKRILHLAHTIRHLGKRHSIQWNAGMGNRDTLHPNSCFRRTREMPTKLGFWLCS